MSIFNYKQTGRIGLFDRDETSEKLSKLGNPLEKLHKIIDFNIFRQELEATMINHDKKSPKGCKPYDVVMMFKIILLKRFYNLSDEQAEYQINDRLSFKDFLGLKSGDKVPDSRTIWLFQENLIQKNLEEKLFEKFHKFLEDLGLFVNEGKIVDACFVEVPRQRNKKEENEKIKAGEGAALWNDQPKKKSQKDIDARLCEHIFGFITNSMNDLYIQAIGFQRAKGIIGLINLVYNMCRYEQIVRLKLLTIKTKQITDR
jgi:transposase